MASATGGDKMKRNVNGSKGMKSVGVGLGAVFAALVFAAGPVLAGSYEWVTVDGNSIANGGQCSALDYGSEVIGVYDPNSPWQAVLEWKLGSGTTWHSISTFPGTDGTLAFRFNVTDNPNGSDTLNIRAWDTDVSPPSGPYPWSCHQ